MAVFAALGATWTMRSFEGERTPPGSVVVVPVAVSMTRVASSPSTTICCTTLAGVNDAAGALAAVVPHAVAAIRRRAAALFFNLLTTTDRVWGFPAVFRGPRSAGDQAHRLPYRYCGGDRETSHHGERDTEPAALTVIEGLTIRRVPRDEVLESLIREHPDVRGDQHDEARDPW